ncbi:MAG: alpha/beta hydrolase [Anaerolineales bacterium]
MRSILAAAAVLLAVGIAAALVWASASMSTAEPAVEAYLQSSEEVTVASNPWLAFRPSDADPKVGFIFYPGGNVDHQAYAPALFEIAAQGFLVVDVEMPLGLAFLGLNKALEVIEAYPEIDTWVIGGHSLGGAMAARFASQHPGIAAGLVLWAAYPAGSDDLSQSEIRVISISGSQDGLAQPDEIAGSVPLLPEDTVWVVVEGGNHAQFGHYGVQRGDNLASISRQVQQEQVITATVSFLAQFVE